MPAELFRSDLPSTTAPRRASLLPVSLAVHVAIIGTAVLMPVVADGELPPVVQRLPMAYTPVAAPPAPPPAPIRSAQRTSPHTSPANAPLDAPAEISSEPAIEPATVGRGVDLGDLAGVDFGPAGSLALPSPAYVPPPLPDERKPVRPGGKIEPPRIVRRVQPVYPVIAQTSRVQGTVVIEALIGNDGRVRNAVVMTGRDVLNDAALAAVRQWVFTPTRLNGEPVEVIMTVTVVFSLQ